MSARFAKANILDLRGTAVLYQPKMAVSPVKIPAHPTQAEENSPKHSRLPLHSASIGILGGLLAVVLIGGVVPMLPARTVSPVAQAAQSALASTSTAPAAAPGKVPGVAKPIDRLTINRLGTDAPIVELGLTGSGAIDTPKTLWQVGHYNKSAVVGANGTAVLVGHSGAPGQVGVFEHINQIKVGDIVTYTRTDGTTIAFRAISSQAYPVNDETAQLLVAPTTKSSLNLISCFGKWNTSTQVYDQRWIVKTERID